MLVSYQIRLGRYQAEQGAVMSNVHSEKRNDWLFPGTLGVVACCIAFAIVFGFMSKKPRSTESAQNQISSRGLSLPNQKPVQNNAEVKADSDPLNGVPTGDSYVLIIASAMTSCPDTGKLYRDNARLEQLGYIMDPDSLDIKVGYGANVIHAVYHKKK